MNVSNFLTEFDQGMEKCTLDPLNVKLARELIYLTLANIADETDTLHFDLTRNDIMGRLWPGEWNR
jgi:hypothetical protein